MESIRIIRGFLRRVKSNIAIKKVLVIIGAGNYDFAGHLTNWRTLAMENIRLAQLQTFSKIVELETFSAVAEFFGVTQPAITAQIRELEKVLGVCLIERSKKFSKAKPTPAGKELIKHVKKIDGAFSRMLVSMEKYQTNAGE